MEILGLIAGLGLPWLLGVIWLRAQWFDALKINWPTLLGYGYLAGALATTWVMRILDVAGVKFGFTTIALCLAALAAIGVWASRKNPMHWPAFGSDWYAISGWRRAAFAALCALIVVRLANLGLEIVLHPLLPWDAWSQWATKARVWYELGHMAPFVSREQWLAGAVPGAYTDAAPHYPPAIPLLQVWMSYSIGRWDDALMNLPWLQCSLALGLAFYGQARRWGTQPLLALMFTYFLLSLPVLDTHVALGGYADLFMAAFVGLAAMAFFHWIRYRDRWDGAVALLFAIGCMFIKVPGIAWMLTFVPAYWIAADWRSGRIGAALLFGMGILGVFMLSEMENLTLLGYSLPRLHFASVWEPMRENLLVMDNWHLLWYLAGAVMVLSVPRLFSKQLCAMTVLVLSGAFFLAVVFFFTVAQVWAEDYTTLNRAFLHMVPMLLFYVLVLCGELRRTAVRIIATTK